MIQNKRTRRYVKCKKQCKNKKNNRKSIKKRESANIPSYSDGTSTPDKPVKRKTL